MRYRVLLPIAVLSVCWTLLHAEPITNWHTFKANTATTLSGQGTSSPVFGSPSASAATAFLIGYFDALSLTNLGDRLTLSHRVSFTDAAGMSSQDDQYRFALYDMNGQPRVTDENTASAGVAGFTDDWRGYWFGVDSSQAGTAAGTIRERTAGNLHPIANAGTTLIGRPTGAGVLFASSTSPAGGPSYSGEMAIERTPNGLALAGYFGGNGTTNIFAVNDNAAPHPVNFGAFGVLNGGPSSCDQFNFQDVTITYSFSNALEITSHPADVQVNAGEPARFMVQWTGSGLLPSFQWRENGSAISGATNSSYTIAATTPGQNNNTYSVVISNVFGDSVTSSNATLTVISDSTPPTVLSASSLTLHVINVIFSEPVEALSAGNSSSYSLPGNSIAEITMIGNTNAELTVDEPITTNYVLTVQNVRDLSGNTMVATNMAGIAHSFADSVALCSNGVAFAFNEKIVVHADGAGILGTKDEFHYVYRLVTGDFDVAVRVESLLNTDPNARAGIMARVPSGFVPVVIPESRNIMIEATPARFIFQYRTNAAGANTLAVGSPRPATAFPNNWVRLMRTGPLFTAYSSTSAGAWTLMGAYDTSVDAEGAYPDEILLGLAVTSRNLDEITQAIFSDFRPVLDAPLLSIARNGTDIELSWPSSATGFNLQATPSLNSTTWTNVPGSSATNRMLIGPASSALFFRLRH
jgi:hypothetical protein